MYSLLILGQIPGTSISISFEVWIIITILTGLIVFRKRHVIMRFIDELENPHKYRKPIHADKLHFRV